ncbi:alpha/beta fold hydrolase [Aquimarina sp. BL5]|uniref:alpha/beta fold hydrolase n=1 Tax=Aquimarina sp. BL5 TaxID=1714860 RepID=UPI000E4695A7|nr:alpha/beta fold hydrolase [Aquimarina sp. BL5]AXT52386.1 alpha/beta fold hydrolase [Aquimarina sp. BL5]RKN10300.1 alpha/beta fold hydrolase [Aquimarina sp. BL5]
MTKPKTTYTKCGDINIAYQVFGSGSVDLVYIPGWVSNIDWMWSCPELVSFFEELGKFARVILFDKRGTGLSDRVVEFATLEERMEDITAVMDAVGSEKAVLFGHSEGGSVSALFSATYPDRVISLITFGIFAKRKYSKDYPWAPTDQERQVVYDMIENDWGSGDMNLASLAPSKVKDQAFMDWLASYFRSGASPTSALKLTKMNTQVDIIDILGSIKVPTLLLQRTDDIDVKIQEGQFIAERIPGSRFLELEGSDHLFWVGDTDVILEAMKAFINDIEPAPVYEKKLFTVMVGHIIASDNHSSKNQELIKENLRQHHGKIIDYTSQTFTATFEGPSKAVNCGSDLVKLMRVNDTSISLGIDIKECNVQHCICEQTGDFEETIFQKPAPYRIILTQTVKNLLLGSGVSLAPHKTRFKTESGESISLYTVVDNLKPDKLQNSNQHILSKHNSFLEKVLQNIHNHLSNDCFGVTTLCMEIGVSERQLQRKLKAITNKSPNQLISSVRLHYAKELLLDQQNTVAEIAFQTGFSSPSYFSKCFKREFAMSPSELVN